MDLAHLGMVEIIRNRGFRVPVLTRHDLDEIFKIRAMLEVPAISEVAQVLDSGRVPAFQRLAEQITQAAREGDLTAFLDQDRQLRQRRHQLAHRKHSEQSEPEHHRHIRPDSVAVAALASDTVMPPVGCQDQRE